MVRNTHISAICDYLGSVRAVVAEDGTVEETSEKYELNSFVPMIYVFKRLVIAVIILSSYIIAYAQITADSLPESEEPQENNKYIPRRTWKKNAVEKLRLHDDSTFTWDLTAVITTGQTAHAPSFGQGKYSILEDTIVLNSNFQSSIEIKFKEERKYNKNKRKIIIQKSPMYVIPALFVLYINEAGDTVFSNNLEFPDSWSKLSTPRYSKIELNHPKEIIDIVVDGPWTFRPKDMQAINQHNGDIEILCNFIDEPMRVFNNEKWTIKGDTIYPLTEDGYKSIYPLVFKDSVFISSRKSYGKPYDGEYRGKPDGFFSDSDDNFIDKVHFNDKYYRQAIANGFKTYGIITRGKWYDDNNKLVAEGEYLSDTRNMYLRWYRYIKVGRWKYYEPDGTIRYVDY